jgi:hypothetical protein
MCAHTLLSSACAILGRLHVLFPAADYGLMLELREEGVVVRIQRRETGNRYAVAWEGFRSPESVVRCFEEWHCTGEPDWANVDDAD